MMSYRRTKTAVKVVVLGCCLLRAAIAEARDDEPNVGISNIIRLDVRAGGAYETSSNTLALDTRMEPGQGDLAPLDLVAYMARLETAAETIRVIFSETLCHVVLVGNGEPENETVTAGVYQYVVTGEAASEALLELEDGREVLLQLIFTEEDVGVAAWKVTAGPTPVNYYFAITGPVPDRDYDGLEDDWEQDLIDFDPNDIIANVEQLMPGDDFDGDGETNIIEAEGSSDAADATSTVQPGNAYTSYELGFARHVQQRVGKFREVGYEARLNCYPPAGKTFTSGWLTAPEERPDQALELPYGGAEARYTSGILDGERFAENFASGKYRIRCRLRAEGRESSLLRFSVDVRIPGQSEGYPTPVGVLSHEPFSIEMPTAPVFSLSSSDWAYSLLRDDYDEIDILRIPNMVPPDADLAVPQGFLETPRLYVLQVLRKEDVKAWLGSFTHFWFATGSLALLPDGWNLLAPPTGRTFTMTIDTVLGNPGRHEDIGWIHKRGTGAAVSLDASLTPLSPERPFWIRVTRPLLYNNSAGSGPIDYQLELEPGWNPSCIPDHGAGQAPGTVYSHPAVLETWEWNAVADGFVHGTEDTGPNKPVWILSQSAAVIDLSP